jgi:ABC-2 type transport system ATP-binding protein
VSVAAAQEPTHGFAVITKGLVRDYGNGAGLHGIDLAVPDTGVYALVGPNGAGKTTLLSILTGLRRADSGEVQIAARAGRPVMCPDAPEFEPWLTAAEVVGQSRGLARRGRRAAATRAAPAAPGPADDERDPILRVLGEVGLADTAGRRVGGFSRGMTQRLGLAVALALDPKLIVLDEPTSALDPAGRAELLLLIAGLAHERAVIFSSHILADVQRIADHIGVLDHGRLLFQGPTHVLIDSYIRPAWEIRVRGQVEQLAVGLRREGWVASVQVLSSDALRVEAVSAEAGESSLPGALAVAGVRLVGVSPVDADLEAAFLALTGQRCGDPDGGGRDRHVRSGGAVR